jgi:ribosome silencing factor RsfS/YbeB/iojap
VTQLPPGIAAVLEICEDKKAENIATYELSAPQYTDYAVICSAQNTIQIKAIATDLQKSAKDGKFETTDVLNSGNANSGWVIVEIPGLVSVHITLQPIRDYYELDEVYSHRTHKA